MTDDLTKDLLAADDPFQKLATVDDPLSKYAAVEDPYTKAMRGLADDPIQKLMQYEDPFEKAVKAARESPITKLMLDDSTRKTLQDQLFVTGAISGLDRFSQLLHDPAIQTSLQRAHEMSRVVEDSGFMRFTREMELHGGAIEATASSKWMFGIGSVFDQAHKQMSAFADSGIFRVLKHASEVSQQFELTGISKLMVDLGTERWQFGAIGQASELARSIGHLAVQPHIAALMGDRIAGANLYRKMGLDFAGMAGASSVSTNTYFDDAATGLADIEKAIAAGQTNYDVAAVTRSFGEVVHALAVAVDGEASSVERRALVKILQFLIPILISLWIWHAQHLETLESQKSSDKTAALAHQDALATQRAIEALAARLAHEHDDEAGKAFYGVARLVPLCEGPKYRGPNKFVLLPGTEVEVIRKHGKWVIACAVDPAGGAAEGWVLKKYLRSSRR